MNEADILACTYLDSCDVFRPFREKNEHGETVSRSGLEGKLVHICIPCALAKQSGGKLQQSLSVATAATEHRLFVRPEVDILAGDTVLVTQLGRQRLFTAGEADRHVSHNNVPLVPEKAVV